MKIKKGIAGALCIGLIWGMAAQAKDGAALYEQYCKKCHGTHGDADTWRGFIMFAAELSDVAWQEKNTDADILQAIRRGPGAMPAFEDKLPPQDIRLLLDYVRSLRREKPE